MKRRPSLRTAVDAAAVAAVAAAAAAAATSDLFVAGTDVCSLLLLP